jgi:stage III sporulation protein AB
MAMNLSGRVAAIEGSAALLGQLSDRLKYLQPSMFSLMDSVASTQQFERLGYPAKCRELMRAGLSFPESWRQALREVPGRLGPQETQALLALADILGCADLDSQLSALDYTAKLLESRLGAAREYEQKYAKLYRTLGVLGGVAIAIIII